MVLGGDGTILRALQRYAGTEVPVFAVNFGEIGFLATVEPEDIEDGIHRALSGDFELLRLPGDRARRPGGTGGRAINDVAIHRKVGERVAELAYALDGEEVGSVRCDGLVIATPGGLDRLQPRQRRPGDGVGGRGVRGLVHRAPLARPPARWSWRPDPADDPQPLAGAARRLGRRAPRVRDPGPAARSTRVSSTAVGTIAQLPGSSFYRRLREKFGRLAR